MSPGSTISGAFGSTPPTSVVAGGAIGAVVEPAVVGVGEAVTAGLAVEPCDELADEAGAVTAVEPSVEPVDEPDELLQAAAMRVSVTVPANSTGLIRMMIPPVGNHLGGQLRPYEDVRKHRGG